MPRSAPRCSTAGWQAEPVFRDGTNEDDHTYQGRFFWRVEFRDKVLAHLNAERAAERAAGLTLTDTGEDDGSLNTIRMKPRMGVRLPCL